MLLSCLQSQLADDALLTKKDNRDVLENLPERMQGVHRFMELFKPSLVYDIVPIHDVYGPTATDPNIQALVVSKETASGGRAGKCLMEIVAFLGGVFTYVCVQVDKCREEKGLARLRTFAIDVISHTSYRLEAEDVETLKQAKMSSTYIRQWIVSRQKREG